MNTFNVGDKVVHLGGTLGLKSRNRGRVLTIMEGPLRIMGYEGIRYIVDKPVHLERRVAYHANADYLLKLK